MSTGEDRPQAQVVSIPIRDAMTADMDAMERDLPQLKRYYWNRAVLYRQFYLGLVAQGFSNEDALVLVTAEFS